MELTSFDICSLKSCCFSAENGLGTPVVDRGVQSVFFKSLILAQDEC